MKITPKIIELTAQVYILERQKEVLDDELKPLRAELLEKVTECGKFEAGDHIIIKKHVDEAEVKAFTRKAYDTISVK